MSPPKAGRLRRVELAEGEPTEDLAFLRRSAVPDPSVRAGAAAICEAVATGGDAAVAGYARSLGGGFRRVDAGEIEEALAATDPAVIEAIEEAIAAVTAFHRKLIPSDISVEVRPGVEITRRFAPLRRVGCYVPGGKASYPSTVVMTVIPARIAGVSEVVVCSPEGPDGRVDRVMLAACALAGASEVWAVGGAQAVAAMAHGTESLRPVQKIVGPGNSWVTAAKLAVFGVCGIDLPAGPSEVAVLADSSADPRLVAVDLLCQAEHGPDSPALLVTADPTLPGRVEAELDALLPRLERAAILEEALANHGLAVITPDHATAVEVVNRYAGEHVSIMTRHPDEDAKQITAAGSVYVGKWSPESAGDYATGANHVLPTGGLAAAYGPLSVEDFGSWRQEQRLTREGLSSIVSTISTLAHAEGLTAHALAATIRLDPLASNHQAKDRP